jgi:hypothetical protein
MTNYIFYKIHLKVPNEELKEFCYVGRTTNFNQRKRQHKSGCNNENDKHYNLPVYCYIRGNGNWDAWIMEALEEVEYETLDEALIRERYWCDNEGGKLNLRIPSREQKEYYKENKEYYNQYGK